MTSIAETVAELAREPQGNPKDDEGRKKPCVSTIPMQTLLEVAKVMKLGAGKYGIKNYRVQPIKASTYFDAIFRHSVDWYEGSERTNFMPQDIDDESLAHHLAHIAACALLTLDAVQRGNLIDDRQRYEVKRPG